MSPARSLSKKKASRPALALIPLGLAGFFLLLGYELARPASKSLFIEAYGASNILWVMAGSPLILFFMIYVYGRLLTLLKPWKTFLASKVIILVIFLILWVLLRWGWKPATAILYMFREAYIMLIVEQCWSFVNSRVPARQAKKVYGLFLAATGLGASAGSYIVSNWATSLGSLTLIPIAAATILPSAFLAYLAFEVAGEPVAPSAPVHDTLALGRIFSSRLLLIMAGLVLVTQAVGALLEYRMDLMVGEVFPPGSADLRTAYYGGFQLWVNVIGTGFQLIGAPVIMAFLDPRKTLVSVPVAQVVTIGILFLKPSLGAAAMAFGTFKVFDYSIHRAAKEILYIPLGFEERYRAKQVIDGFGYRGSKASISLGLIGLKSLGTLGPSGYGAAALGLLGVWLGLVLGLPQSVEPKRLS